MTVFDLAFLVWGLITVIALLWSTVTAIGGHGVVALRRLGVLGIFWVMYLGVGLVASAVQPQQVTAPGTPWCFDDWCLTLDRVSAEATGNDVTYTTALSISSRARRVRQRANGAWIYLIDAAHHRYAPSDDLNDVPLDIELGPGETVRASRRFVLPAGVEPVGLITGHGGPYCGAMDFLIVGGAGCLFGKPAMIRLPPAHRPASGGR